MSMMPNTSVRPAASRNSIRPNCTPFSACSRKRIGVMACCPQRRLLHAAVFGPEGAVGFEDGADLAIDDAPLAILHEFAQVVVLELHAVLRFLPFASRCSGTLWRLRLLAVQILR